MRTTINSNMYQTDSLTEKEGIAELCLSQALTERPYIGTLMRLLPTWCFSLQVCWVLGSYGPQVFGPVWPVPHAAQSTPGQCHKRWLSAVPLNLLCTQLWYLFFLASACFRSFALASASNRGLFFSTFSYNVQQNRHGKSITHE